MNAPTLAAALEIEGLESVLVLSGGTDGTDGATDAAGAVAEGETIKRAEELGINILDYIQNNKQYFLLI